MTLLEPRDLKVRAEFQYRLWNPLTGAGADAPVQQGFFDERLLTQYQEPGGRTFSLPFGVTLRAGMTFECPGDPVLCGHIDGQLSAWAFLP